MSAYIIALTGVSGAGKDSVARFMRELEPKLQNVKSSLPMKRMLALAYDIEPEQLEDRNFRNQVVPNHPDGCTYLDVMIRAFEYFPLIDANMMVGNVLKQAKTRLKYGYPLIFTDIRNFTEVDAVRELIREGYPLYQVEVFRPKYYPKKSDINFGEINSQLFDIAIGYYLIDNRSTLDALKIATHRNFLGIKNDYTTRNSNICIEA